MPLRIEAVAPRRISIVSPDGAQRRSGDQGYRLKPFGSTLVPGTSPGRQLCQGFDSPIRPGIGSRSALRFRPRPNLLCFPGGSAATIRGPEPQAEAFRVDSGPRIAPAGRPGRHCGIRVRGAPFLRFPRSGKAASGESVAPRRTPVVSPDGAVCPGTRLALRLAGVTAMEFSDVAAARRGLRMPGAAARSRRW